MRCEKFKILAEGKKIIWFSQQYQFHNLRNMHIWPTWDIRSQSHTRDPTDHPRRKTPRENRQWLVDQTKSWIYWDSCKSLHPRYSIWSWMHLHKTIRIPHIYVDTTTISTTILTLILTLFPGPHSEHSWKSTKELLREKMVLNTLSQRSFTAGDNRAPNGSPISKTMTSLKLRNKVSSNKRGHQYPRG